jgi:hypothetical protein
MGFLVSPGVDVNEIDLTNVIPAVSTSIGGYAGPFRWGPVEEIKLVSSESELASVFGEPDAFYAESFFTASSFLKYGNSLKAVRASNSQLVNAVSGSVLAQIGGIGAINIDAANSSGALATGLTGDTTVTITGNDQKGTVLAPRYTIDTVTVNTAGSDFASGEISLNDTIDVDLGNNNTATLEVTTMPVTTTTSGVVDTLTVTSNIDGDFQPGTYNNVTVYNTGSQTGTGTGLTANVTITNVAGSGNNHTIVVTIANGGSGYAVGDTLRINDIDIVTETDDDALDDADHLFLTVGTLTSTTNTTDPVFTLTSNPTLTGVPTSVTGVATDTVVDTGTAAVNDLTVDLTFALTGVAVTTAGSGHTISTTTLTIGGTELAASGNYSIDEAQVSQSNAILIKNETHFESGITAQGALYARYAGVLGNSIQVDVFDQAAFTTGQVKTNGVSANTLTDVFDSKPATDEYHIVVTDLDGALSGTAGTILETWPFVGINDGAKKEDGSNNYYKDVINENSDYFYVTDTPVVGTNSFTDGADQTTVVAGDITDGIDLFSDSATVDVNLVFAYNDDNGSETIAEYLIQVASARKDIVVFTSPPIEDSTGNSPLDDVKDWCDGITSTSYAVLDSTAIYTYNKFADKYLYIPACGHVAGLCANTDDVAEPWFSPAGYNRGQLLGITKLAYNPKQADRDELYKARINPIVSFPGQGTLLFGDKTAQAKPSAFDRINVRRLFIVLEKAIATAAKYQLFELNDEFTRSMFRNMTEPFLRDVKGRRGVTDFLVVCDETNNTGQVIDTNRFVADIYIKPARSINFITLNFIATRTGVEFSEIVGK